jgi:hypothetical protein
LTPFGLTRRRNGVVGELAVTGTPGHPRPG